MAEILEMEKRERINKEIKRKLKKGFIVLAL